MLSRFFQRLRFAISRFMYGRYGNDKLNISLLVTAVVCSVIGMIFSHFGAVCRVISMVLTLLAYVLLGFYLFRLLSRNLDKRRRENRNFLNRTAFLWDRQNRYYHCPKCKQTVRVPRGHGKICIRCPRCSEKFVRKS